MFNKAIYHLKVIKSQTIADPVNNGYKMKLAFNYLRWLLFYKHNNKDWIIYFDNGYRSKVKPYPDHDSGSMNIWTRNVDYHEIEFIRKQLQKGDWIIDGGCNVGNRTWAMADLLGGAILVDANPKAIARTRENLVLNGLPKDKYLLVENALGDKPGVIRFSDKGGAMTNNRILAEGEDEGASVSMEMTTIDLLVAKHKVRPAFIKLDVEGYDYFALKGAEQTLRSGSVKLVKFEILDFAAFGQFKELFSSIGWEIFALTEKGQPVADEAYFEKQLNLFAAPAAVCKKYL